MRSLSQPNAAASLALRSSAERSGSGIRSSVRRRKSDELNRPTLIKELGVTTLAQYAYDDLSRRTTVALGNATTTSYGFDAQGMLQTLGHDLVGTAQDVTFTYARNQRQEIKTLGWSNPLYGWTGVPGSRTFTPNGLNQYTAVNATPVSYDSNGNLTTDGTWTYTFDADNRLRTANAGGVAATLSWDAGDRLRQTTISGSTTNLLYDGTRLIAEYDATGTLLRRYVHGVGTDEPLVQYEGAGTSSKTWYYANHQGSVVATADAAGTASAAYSYGPFGETAGAPARFGYTGQQYLAQLGLYHYKARFYSPTLGRFLQTDPIGIDGGINLYAYVGNDPLNAIDPLGLFEFPSIPQFALNFLTGVSDAASLGLGPLVRQALGVSGGVDVNSGYYTAGQYASLALGAGRLAYAGTAKLLPQLVTQGITELETALAVSEARNTLKQAFRVGTFQESRIYTPEQVIAKYGGNAEAITAAATRTDPVVNAVGADLTIGAVVGGVTNSRGVAPPSSGASK